MKFAVALGIAIFGMVLLAAYASTLNAAEAARKASQPAPLLPHKARAKGCPQVPCTDVPASCYMHGGAPTNPECLRD